MSFSTAFHAGHWLIEIELFITTLDSHRPKELFPIFSNI